MPNCRHLGRRRARLLTASQLIEPRSELSVTGFALAMRVGHKMGLHRTGAEPHIPFFEQEMRLRVWWQLRGRESQARRTALGLPLSYQADFGDVRMPLNVNDADLHPRMEGPPTVEHTGPAEMLYCLMKYEFAHWIRTSPTVSTSVHANPQDLITSTSTDAMRRKRQALAELDPGYRNKYVRKCNKSIPLHHLSATVVDLTVHRMRFWCYHPRHQPEDGKRMSRADQDTVFESSVRMLQLDYEMATVPYSAHLLEHMMARTQVDALVYMMNELRLRVSGDLVRTAWSLVERLYGDYPDLLQDDGKFYTALADLTLEGWEARRRELRACGNEVAVPRFIELLQVARGKAGAGSVDDGQPAAIGGMALEGEPSLGMAHDDPFDWEYWNEFLHL